MLTVRVKFINGLEKVFHNVDYKSTSISNDLFVVGVEQEYDQNGKLIAGTTYRMPITSVIFIESTETEDGETVEGEVTE
jgi:hypothetical protein